MFTAPPSSAVIDLFTVAQARAFDRRAQADCGIAADALMQRAGDAAWRLLLARWPQARRIGVACGPGNNGGDGYVLARLARESGLDVVVVGVSTSAPREAAAQQALSGWHATGGSTLVFDAGVAAALPPVEVWVDALFGIGLSRAPDGTARALIDAINASGVPVLALDVPSGVDADRGHAPGVAIRADVTLQFIVAKRGLATGVARTLCGELALDSLALPDTLLGSDAPAARLYRPAALSRWLGRRARDAHKGRFGHVLCIGGEHGMGGAVALCAQAALRSGAGLVSAATRRDHVAALIARQPEVMAHAVEDSADFDALLAPASVLALGPGLGQGEWGQALFTAALASGKPVVLDADALNLLAAAPRRVPHAVLTPHPGEAARLLGCDSATINADRFAAAHALVERFGAVVVLKGAGSIVAAPDATPALIDAGNPGMAVGGMGDLLTGVIAALCAQHLPLPDAALCGALLHAAAGDAAAGAGGERGLLPSDLLPQLRRLANPASDGTPA